MPFPSHRPQSREHRTHPPATKDSADSLPAPAESRQGGCTMSWVEDLAQRPALGGLVAAVFLLGVSLGLSVLIVVVAGLMQ